MSTGKTGEPPAGGANESAGGTNPDKNRHDPAYSDPVVIPLPARAGQTAEKHSGATQSTTSMPIPGAGPSQPSSHKIFWREHYLLILFIALVTFSSIIMTPWGGLALKEIRSGAIAQKNIRAKSDVMVQDIEATGIKRKTERDAVLDLYDLDTNIARETSARVTAAFDAVQAVYRLQAPQAYEAYESGRHDIKTIGELASVETSREFREATAAFVETIGLPDAEKFLPVLKKYKYDRIIPVDINQALSQVMSAGVVYSKEFVEPTSRRGLTLRDISTGIDRRVEDLRGIYDITEAKAAFRKAILSQNPEPAQLRNLIDQLGSALIRPNLSFNKKETSTRKQEAFDTAKPVFFLLQRGEMVVREGEKITEAHMPRLNAILGGAADISIGETIAGFMIFNALVFLLVWIYMNKFHIKLLAERNNLLLLAILVAVNISMMIAFKAVDTSVFEDVTGMGDTPALVLLTPFAAGPMIAAILFGGEAALVFTLVITIMASLTMGRGAELALFPLVGGLVSVFHVGEYTRRSSILRVGLYISVANMITAFTIGLIGNYAFTATGGLNLLLGFAGGLLSGIVVSGLLPVAESLFPVLSDIKLVELSDLNHPLLSRMVLEAPGTYHHSLMVANLAEEAAESIGANHLLCRVGALFHDIGKISKPEYYYENTLGGANAHDKLAPSMSALIIKSHVRDGVETARAHKLYPQIIDFIREHHGTTIMSYFYSKAVETADPHIQNIHEQEYRYPGPKPQSRETAIVALADSVEAAARALPEPTPENMEHMVHEIINAKFTDGQLDDCNLTFVDLNKIITTFMHILQGIHHHRIQYPGRTTTAKPAQGEPAGSTKTSQPGIDDASPTDDPRRPPDRSADGADKKKRAQVFKRFGIR